MKSKTAQDKAPHYFFLLFAGIQLIAAALVYIKNGLNFALESVIVTSAEVDVSFLTIYIGLLGIAYVLLLCAIFIVAVLNINRS